MENGGLLTKGQIFAAQLTPSEEIRVPEWGGTVRVKAMTAAEGNQFADLLGTPEFKDHQREALVVMCVVDDKGAPVFEPGDLELIKAIGNHPFTSVYVAAARVNGFGQAAIEQAEKNS